MPILLSDVIKELNISIEQAEICLSEETDLGDVDFGKDYELTDEQYDILKERFGKKEIVEGQIVPCTIKLILNDGIIVALSEQEEGIISERELIMHPELQVEDTIDVLVGSSIDVNGRRRVSYTRALSRRKWDILKDIKQKGEIIQGYIKSSNKGGFIVDVMNLEAFLPGSQIDINSIDDFDQYVRTTMDFMIIELNPSLHRFVVSHRAIIEEERRREILSMLEEGSLLEGTVKKIMPYGVLVKAGSILGLIQKTDLSWNYCNNPHDVVTEGQKLIVVVLKIDQDKKKVAFGLKQLYPNPWDEENGLIVGSKIEGKVKNITNYGAFIEIMPGVKGLLHVSEISWKKGVDINNVLHVGDKIETIVKEVDKDDHKIQLSIKQLQSNPWDNITEKYAIGSIHTGIIRKIAKHYFLVEFEDGVEGFLHATELSWTKKFTDISQFASENDEIQVVVEDINADQRKLTLSHKRLSADPWKNISLTYPIGSKHVASIRKALKHGLLAELEEGIEGFIDVTELSWIKKIKDATQFSISDDKLEVVVLGYDTKKRKVSLSYKRIVEDPWAKADETTFGVNTVHHGIVTDIKGKRYVIRLDNGIEAYSKEKDMLKDDNTLAQIGESLDFKVVTLDIVKRQIILSHFALVDDIRKNSLRKKLERGIIVQAIIAEISKTGAYFDIEGVKCFIPKDQLSPNKISSVSEEVFVGEILRVVFLYEDEGQFIFSKSILEESKYDEALYDCSLDEIFATMGIRNNSFAGKVTESATGEKFLSNLIVLHDENDEDYGKLLVDPVNGKSLSAFIGTDVSPLYQVNEYYKVVLSLSWKEYRKKSGTPYLFCIEDGNPIKIENPYKEVVELTYRKQASPSQSTSIAHLLEEVGINLYTSKKRMFFELLQNADDASAKAGVNMKVQICNGFFVVTHNGYAFNRSDFYSITSAAQSTKSANKKKTGYKGIGFKSVFSNSTCVYIKSRGFTFSFDKTNPEYEDFKAFYFKANGKTTPEEQSEFLRIYGDEYRQFRGVKDIPWQLLPIWDDTYPADLKKSIFHLSENVSIALAMPTDALEKYSQEVEEVFNNPRFMLFLRNTRRLQLLLADRMLTIQKERDIKNKNLVYLKNSFMSDSKKLESYMLSDYDDITVSDESFEHCGINIIKKSKTNKQGQIEYYFSYIDDNGNEGSEVTGVPDRIASATSTTISFAVLLDNNMDVIPVKDSSTIYAYLPMNDERFKFPFYVNADFIPNSQREGISNDNPWNHFLFYNIGRKIAQTVANFAAIEHPQYLNLLVSSYFKSDDIGTDDLISAFNRGYEESIKNEVFILSHKGNIVKQEDIVIDDSCLSSVIGCDAFLNLVGSTKELPSPDVDSRILKRDMFTLVEHVTQEKVLASMSTEAGLTILHDWVNNASDEDYKKLIALFSSILEKTPQTRPIIDKFPIYRFEDNVYSLEFVMQSNNYCFTIGQIEAVKDILKKIGLNTSKDNIFTHELFKYYKESILNNYGSIVVDRVSECVKTGSNKLDYAERKHLFVSLAKEKLFLPQVGNLPLFKNKNDVLCTPSSLVHSDKILGTWGYHYLINDNEYCLDVDPYLMKIEDVYNNTLYANWASIVNDIKGEQIENLYADSVYLFGLSPQNDALSAKIPYVYTGSKFVLSSQVLFNDKFISINESDYTVLSKAVMSAFGTYTPSHNIIKYFSDKPFTISDTKISSVRSSLVSNSLSLEEIEQILKFAKSTEDEFFNYFIVKKDEEGKFTISTRSSKVYQVYSSDRLTRDFITNHCSAGLVLLPEEISKFCDIVGVQRESALYDLILQSVNVDEVKEELIKVLKYESKVKFLQKLTTISIDVTKDISKSDYEYLLFNLACSEIEDDSAKESLRKKIVLKFDDSEMMALTSIPHYRDEFSTNGVSFLLSQIFPEQYNRTGSISNYINKLVDLGLSRIKLRDLFDLDKKLSDKEVFKLFYKVFSQKELPNVYDLAFILSYHAARKKEEKDIPSLSLYSLKTSNGQARTLTGDFYIDKIDFLDDLYIADTVYANLANFLTLPIISSGGKNFIAQKPYISGNKFVCPHIKASLTDNEKGVLMNYMFNLWKGIEQSKDIDWSVGFKALEFTPLHCIIDKKWTIAGEELPTWITSWMQEDKDKYDFLVAVGCWEADSDICKMREAFSIETSLYGDFSVFNTEKAFFNDDVLLFNTLAFIEEKSINLQSEQKQTMLSKLIDVINSKAKHKLEVFEDFNYDVLKAKAVEISIPKYIEWKTNHTDHSIMAYSGEMPIVAKVKGYGDYVFYTKENGDYAYSNSSVYFNTESKQALLELAASKESWLKFEDLNELGLLSFNNSDSDDEDNSDRLREKGNVPKNEQKAINVEACKAAKEYLSMDDNYDCSAWIPEEDTDLVRNKVRFNGKPIVVAVTSSSAGKIYLYPSKFAALMVDPDNLLLNYSKGIIHKLSFDNIFLNNPNVNLILDSDIVNPKLIASLARTFLYSANTCFVVDNPSFSASETIGFGLKEKVDGPVIKYSDDDDIFSF